jgi:predicted nuclease with TOPRIM domain
MGLVDNFKDLFKIADAANNVELYKKLSELQTRAMELEEETRQLRDEKSQLQQALDWREKMHFKEPFYYQDGDETPISLHVYCTQAKRPRRQER